MLLEPEKLITHRGTLNGYIVDSIKSGIESGDPIPPIETVRVGNLMRHGEMRKCLQDLFSHIPEQDLEEYCFDNGIHFVTDGSHRAYAYNELGLVVPATLSDCRGGSTLAPLPCLKCDYSPGAYDYFLKIAKKGNYRV